MSLLSYLFVILVLLVALFAPGNPDYTFPLSLEILVMGFFCLAVSFSPKNSQVDNKVSFSKEQASWIGLGVILIVFYLTPRLVVSFLEAKKSGLFQCEKAGDIINKLECVFHSPIVDYYGFRTYLQVITSSIVTLLTYLLFSGEKRAKTAVKILAVWTLAFVVVSFVGQIFFGNRIIPSWMGYSVYTKNMTAIISNPGWTWVYLSVGFASLVSLFLSEYSSKIKKILYAVGTIVVALGLLATQQRGALGLILFLPFSYMVWFFFGKKSSSKRESLLKIIFISIIPAILMALYLFPSALREIARSFGYDFKAISFNSPRFEIWRASWDLFLEKPLLGHGYGSWFQAISSMRAKYPNVPVYDTAHNFYVQFIVEHGLIFTLIHVFLLCLIVKKLFEKNESKLGKVFTFGILSSLFVVTLLQEFDYIRPTHYLYGMAFGIMFAFRKGDSNNSRLIRLDQQKFKLSFRLLGASAVLAGMYLLILFPIGVFPYEKGAPFSRWVGPSAKISAGSSLKAHKAYSIIPIGRKYSKYYQITSLDLSTLSLTKNEPKPFGKYIELNNGSKFLPTQHWFTTNRFVKQDARKIAFTAVYPPLQSNLSTTNIKGLYDWESDGINSGRWCNGNCVFTSKSCGVNDKLNFDVTFRGDLEDKHIELMYKVIWLDHKELEDMKALLSMIKETSDQDFIRQSIDSSRKVLKMEFNKSDSNSKKALVIIKSDFSFIPSQMIQGSTDQRKLSFYVREGECN